MNVKPSQKLAQAVHQNKAFSPQGVLERLFTFWFDGFVYNQIWEDPRVDIKGLRLNDTSRILTIASGGCNVLNYLTVQPESIVAVDLNPCHLSLTRLKLAAVTYLPGYDEFFQFFGCADDEQNLVNYRHHLRHRLDDRTREFWEGGPWLLRKIRGPRIHYFRRNLYNHASMGMFLRLLHSLAHIRKIDPRRILTARSREESERLFDELFTPVLDSLPIKALSKLPFILHGLGVPPAQLERVKADANGDLLADYKGRIRRLVCDFPIKDNYFVWQAFGRCYDRQDREAVPDYLKACHFPILKANIHRVKTHLDSLTSFLRTQPKGSFNRFVFLDAQDWMNAQQINELWGEVARVGEVGSRILFRSGGSESVVEPALEPALRKRFVYEKELSRELFRQDRSAIYGGVHVYEMRN